MPQNLLLFTSEFDSSAEIDINKPFSEQRAIREFLRGKRKEPVSVSLLYRLLTVVDDIILKTLKNDLELVGIRVGYELETLPSSTSTTRATTIEDEKKYWQDYWKRTTIHYVGWGGHPSFDKFLKPQENIEAPEPNRQDTNPQLTKLFSKLSNFVKDEIISQVSPEQMKDKNIRTFLLLYISVPNYFYADDENRIYHNAYRTFRGADNAYRIRQPPKEYVLMNEDCCPEDPRLGMDSDGNCDALISCR